MALRIEFTVEPFTRRRARVRTSTPRSRPRAEPGLAVDFGPFGSSVDGDDDQVLAAADAVVRAAIGAGATRVIAADQRPVVKR